MSGRWQSASRRRKGSASAWWLILLLLVSAMGSQGQGRVVAWGYNGDGELGDNSVAESNVPVQALGVGGSGLLSGITAIAAGGTTLSSISGFSLALKSDGTIWAWGDNAAGELGNGSHTNSSTPTQVLGPGGSGFLTGITAIAAGNEAINSGNYGLALRNDGTVWAWGDNSYGELGNGTTTSSVTPVQVKGAGGSGFLTGIVAIAAGYNFNLALQSNGTVWAWGQNFDGQLGHTPGKDGDLSGSLLGYTYYYNPFPTQVTALSGSFTGIAASTTAVALRSDGTVWVWGDNTTGELGHAPGTAGDLGGSILGMTYYYNPVPSEVSLSGTFTGIAIGVSALALRNDGTVWAWGDNSYGELGHASGTGGDVSNGNGGYYNPTPTHIITPSGKFTNLIAVAVYSGFGLALRDDGTVWAWGYNANGQLGNNTTTDSSSPVQVLGLGGAGTLSRIVALAAGANASLALTGYQLAWQNTSTGDTTQWLMNQAKRLSSSDILSGIASAWKMVGTADFNGDGDKDLLWQNTSTGEIGYWQMNGGTYVTYVQISAPGVVPTAWHIVGAGNLNSSSQPNLLFQNASTGEIGFWTLTSGNKYSTYTQIEPPGAVSLAYQIVGVPDFTGTGKANVLFQNTSTGEIGYWTLTSGGTYSSYTQIEEPGVVSTVWHIEATPDVNGDGQSDIVFQNVSTGEVGYWLMKNGQMQSYTQIEAPGTVPTTWRIGGSL